MLESKCTKCKVEPKYTNNSWCSKCINARKRALRAEKKLLGLSAYGDKRNKVCRKCGSEKEENYMNDSLCQACRSETNKDRRIVLRAKKGLPLWGSGRKNTCSTCGNPKEGGRDNESRCKGCKSEAYAINSLSYAERVCDPLFRIKKRAHDLVWKALNAGTIIRKPCEVCGHEKVDGHHDDYTKPLDVRWLCRKHHAEHHKNIKG